MRIKLYRQAGWCHELMEPLTSITNVRGTFVLHLVHEHFHIQETNKRTKSIYISTRYKNQSRLSCP